MKVELSTTCSWREGLFQELYYFFLWWPNITRMILDTLWLFLLKSLWILISKLKTYFCLNHFSPLLSQLLEINNMGRWDGSRSMVLKASKSSGTTGFPLWLCRLRFLGMARLLFRTRLPLLWNTHSSKEHWKRGYWSGAKNKTSCGVDQNPSSTSLSCQQPLCSLFKTSSSSVEVVFIENEQWSLNCQSMMKHHWDKLWKTQTWYMINNDLNKAITNQSYVCKDKHLTKA